jgi:hypothetical protein
MAQALSGGLSPQDAELYERDMKDDLILLEEAQLTHGGLSTINYVGDHKTLGILDIYGFEILATNDLEQFFINYTNEMLQQFFIELTIKEEQAEYDREGIPWEHIEYFDNAPVVALVEAKQGSVLALLDEQCAYKEGSPAVWKSNLQPDFNVRVCDRFDARLSAVLRELDASNRFVQKSAESTSI